MGRRQVVNVHMLSFAHIMNHEATKPVRVTVFAQARECKAPSAPGEVFVKALSDRGSTPLISTKKGKSAFTADFLFGIFLPLRGRQCALSHQPFPAALFYWWLTGSGFPTNTFFFITKDRGYPATICLMFISLPCCSQVSPLPQYGQILPYCNVG